MADEQPVVSEESEKFYTFRHKTYRRFRVGRFEFKDHILKVNAADREEFLESVQDPKFPKREAINIVEVNEEASRNAELSVLYDNQKLPSGVVRGAMNAEDILTEKDKQRLAENTESAPAQSGNALNPNPQAPRPAFKL